MAQVHWEIVERLPNGQFQNWDGTPNETHDMGLSRLHDQRARYRQPNLFLLKVTVEREVDLPVKVPVEMKSGMKYVRKEPTQ